MWDKKFIFKHQGKKYLLERQYVAMARAIRLSEIGDYNLDVQAYTNEVLGIIGNDQHLIEQAKILFAINSAWFEQFTVQD